MQCSLTSWSIGLIIVILTSAFLYWQIVVAEGAYLGQLVVTFLYDHTAKNYDQIKNFDTDMEGYFLGEPIAKLLMYQPAPLVLDVATGTARLPLTLLAQPSFQGRLIGIDHSKKMLEQAVVKSESYSGRISYIWRDATTLPFPDGVFDCVSCLEMLEFTPKPSDQMAEIIRVLRPGGILVTTRRRGLNAALMAGKTHRPAAFKTLLLKNGIVQVIIQRWQVEYDLVWGIKEGSSSPKAHHLLEVLRCPHCGSSVWAESPRSLACQTCRESYPISDGILELRL